MHALAWGELTADPALMAVRVPAQEGYWGLAGWPSLCLESDQAVNLTSFALSLLLVCAPPALLPVTCAAACSFMPMSHAMASREAYRPWCQGLED